MPWRTIHQEALLIMPSHTAETALTKSMPTWRTGDNRWIPSDNKIQGKGETVLDQNTTELWQASQQTDCCKLLVVFLSIVVFFLDIRETRRGALRRSLKGDNEIALQMFTEISSQAWRAVWEEHESTCWNIYPGGKYFIKGVGADVVGCQREVVASLWCIRRERS